MERNIIVKLTLPDDSFELLLNEYAQSKKSKNRFTFVRHRGLNTIYFNIRRVTKDRLGFTSVKINSENRHKYFYHKHTKIEVIKI